MSDLLAMICGQGGGGEVHSSPDLITWSVARAGGAPFDTPRGLAWSPTEQRTVVVGDDGWIATAEDADPTTWTTRANANGFGENFLCAWYGNGLFFAGGQPNLDGFQSSPDGINWSVVTIPGSPLMQVLGGMWVPELGLHVMCGGNAGAGSGKVFTSPDGVTWTERTPASPGTMNNLRSIGWDASVGLLVMCGWGTDHLQTSPDGINWTIRTPAAEGGNTTLYNVRGNNAGQYILVGGTPGNTVIQSSVDGINWVAETGDFPGSYVSAFHCVDWSPAQGEWVIGGRFGEIQTSPDGSTWTRRAHPGSFNDSYWAVIGRQNTPPPATEPIRVTRVQAAAVGEDDVHARVTRVQAYAVVDTTFVPPPPPLPTSDGLPGRAGRGNYGPEMHNERATVDPTREFGAAQANLAFWQGGGIGLCAPKAVLSYLPPSEGPAVLRYGAFSWDQQVYRQLVSPALSYLTISGSGGSGDPYVFDFASLVPGRPDENGDATENALSFIGARACPVGIINFFGSTAEVQQLSATSFEVRTYAGLPRTSQANIPIAVEFF